MCKIQTHWLNILTVAPFCSYALKLLGILKQWEHFTCFWKQKTVTAFTGPQAVWFLLICISDSVCVYSVSCKHALHLPVCFQDVTLSSKHTSCFTAMSNNKGDQPVWGYTFFPISQRLPGLTVQSLGLCGWGLTALIRCYYLWFPCNIVFSERACRAQCSHTQRTECVCVFSNASADEQTLK